MRVRLRRVEDDDRALRRDRPAGRRRERRAGGRRPRRVGGDALGRGGGAGTAGVAGAAGAARSGGLRPVLLDREVAPPAPLVPRAVVEARLVAEALGREVDHGGLLADVAVADDGVAGPDAGRLEEPLRLGEPLHPVVVRDEGVEGQVARAGNVAGAGHRARLGAIEEFRRPRVDDRDAGRAEVRLDEVEIGHELGPRGRRDPPRPGVHRRHDVGLRRDDRAAHGLPCRQAAVEERGPLAETCRVEAEPDARRGRDPVLREVDDDARAVADAEALELRAQLVGRQELKEKGALGPRDREVLRGYELCAGDVLLLEVGRRAHVQEDEVPLAPVLDEPVGRHEHVRPGRTRGGREEDEGGKDALHETSGRRSREYFTS